MISEAGVGKPPPGIAGAGPPLTSSCVCAPGVKMAQSSAIKLSKLVVAGIIRRIRRIDTSTPRFSCENRQTMETAEEERGRVSLLARAT